MVISYEAAGLLMATGIGDHLFDPASVAVEQRARRVKIDSIDRELFAAHVDGALPGLSFTSPSTREELHRS
jgi:hypothetical protein